MRGRSGIQGVASSPTIVGAVTVLVVIVAVFLAYNANQGLPFVSTYDIHARVPNANAIVTGNEVRIGGARVGTVRGVRPVQLEGGRFVAELDLSLDPSAAPLPADSTMILRPKSPLGLKYLEIVPGDSGEEMEAGETLPVSAARPEPVDIDQFFDTFDEPTRRSIQRVNAGFGNALAGRGPQFNSALGSLRRLAENAQPVLATIVAPETNFGGFWRALEDFSATLAPVAETQASLFVALDRTFAAFARVSRPYIQETIEKGPPTLDVSIDALPVLRPFFRSSERFFAALGPGAKALGRTSPTIDAALRAGIPALNRSPALYAQLEPTADALLAFQRTPGVFNGFDLLVDTNRLLDGPLRFLTPAQTKCRYLSLAFKNLAGAFGEGNDEGNWLSAISFEGPIGPNAETAPSSAPASGPGGTPGGDNRTNFLHFNPYPRTAAPGQEGVCEAGNERYVRGQTVIGRAPELWGTSTENEEER